MRAQRRKRIRTACIPCQVRKRKCSGTHPCSICARLNSECHYTSSERSRRFPASRLASNPDPGSDVEASPPSSRRIVHELQDEQLSPLEVNSGAVYARKLGLKMDPDSAPKLNLFAWNLGLRPSNYLAASLTAPPASIAEIITHDEMSFLAAIYFEKVNQYYPFLDHAGLFREMDRAWPSAAPIGSVSTNIHEAILCGVAALGCLFSERQPSSKEGQLLALARVILEHHNHIHTPSIDLITAWVLRVSYLRIAGTPHLAWTASCSLMHLIEAAGLHMEMEMEQMPNATREIRRKLFGIARHFNLWMSFELSRTPVKLPSATAKLPQASTEPKDIFSFLAMSENLDHEHMLDIPTLKQALVEVMSIKGLRLPMILTQCNLMLCIHRRLQYLDVRLAGGLLEDFIRIAQQGLRAARQSVLSHCPWHHVPSVPFQLVCALLSLETYPALALLPEAVQSLREVATTYDTDVMREAFDTAMSLVKMHRLRKQKDVSCLSKIAMADPPRLATQTELPIAPAQFDSVDLSTDFPLDDGFLGLGYDSLQLDPMLMLEEPWPAPDFL
ncbi:hypothetical protein HDV63DRAFT_390908 [Trichoderma sp. SZMC 28014]